MCIHFFLKRKKDKEVSYETIGNRGGRLIKHLNTHVKVLLTLEIFKSM